jgi:RNA recognition motif-containing protein
MITPIAPPTSLEIVRDRSGVSKGFGFAEFATDDEAKAVITGLNGRDVAGNVLKIGEARPRKDAAPRA